MFGVVVVITVIIVIIMIMVIVNLIVNSIINLIINSIINSIINVVINLVTDWHVTGSSPCSLPSNQSLVCQQNWFQLSCLGHRLRNWVIMGHYRANT